MPKTVKDLLEAVDTTALVARPLSDWRPILTEECQVYVFGENYIAKRFDQINYKFCQKETAREILIDNLYALLRFKYFPQTSEEIDDRIDKIVRSFTANLKTTLKRVSFDPNTDAVYIRTLPDYCVAFRNGVYNFKDDKWLFKYDIIKLERLSNTIYLYDNSYAIMWYLDYDFESLGVKIETFSLEKFIKFMKDITCVPESRNYCFELLYNISHNSLNQFDMKKFTHLCEILGYSVLQSFAQYFVMLIGSGQNGKNSLFDGCFTNRLVPKPASNDLDAIENDRFITGSLENKSHNIFLETSAKTYTESKMLKALTGSMYQTIEQKGVNKYSSVINCKYIWAGNDQENIKFSDDTTGFRRRVNMMEIFYQWDSRKKFLSTGDYYDTTFSDSLDELKNDIMNTTAYVYFAMYGIMIGTKNWTKNFQFTENDWNATYFDVDFTIKESIKQLTLQRILSYITKTPEKDCLDMFYGADKKKLYLSSSMNILGYKSFKEMIAMLNDQEKAAHFFADNDIYISVKHLQKLIGNHDTLITFSKNIRKLFNLKTFERLNANQAYVRCTFISERLKILD
uniref:DNA primase n=1 Tax=Myoviridae sp. ctbEa13 TaxID=2825136 RepID=A0A8S5VB59_9CAUD|nr:MAG TPA: DNA primase [Myoviridae sp. ctbEa13]